jgi:hypothetical protein
LLLHPRQRAIFILLVVANTMTTAIIMAGAVKSLQPRIRLLMDQLAHYMALGRTIPREFGTTKPGNDLEIPAGVVMRQMPDRILNPEKYKLPSSPPPPLPASDSGGWDDVEVEL